MAEIRQHGQKVELVSDGDDPQIAFGKGIVSPPDPSTDLVFQVGGVERARIATDGTGTGLFSGSLTSPLTVTSTDNTRETVKIVGPAQGISILQNQDWAGVAKDGIDANIQSSGDVFYGVNRGGKPVGYGGTAGGCAVFNALIPYYKNYDWSNNDIWSGTVVQTATDFVGVTVIQACPNNNCSAASFTNFGNLPAVKISAQTGGGHTSTPVGTGGGLLVVDASVSSSIRVTKSVAPNAGDALLYLQETLGSTMAGLLILDSAGHQNMRAKTDGSLAAQSLFLSTSTSAYAATNRVLDISGQTLGDIAGGNAYQIVVVDPTLAPTSDVTKSPVGARLKLTISDLNATATLSGSYDAVFASAISTSTAQAVSTLIGVSSTAQNNGAARVSDARGLSGSVKATLGVITNGAALLAESPSIGSGTIDSAYGLHIQNQGSASVTTAYGILIDAQSGSATNRAIKVAGGLVELADGVNMFINTTTGSKFGTTTTAKIGFYNATPVVQPSGTPVAATDLASVIALANSLRTNLLALGLVA